MPFTVYGRVRTITVIFAAMCTNPRIGRALCYRVRTVTVMAKRFPLRPLRA